MNGGFGNVVGAVMYMWCFFGEISVSGEGERGRVGSKKKPTVGDVSQQMWVVWVWVGGSELWVVSYCCLLL